MKVLVGIDGGPQQRTALTLAARLSEGGELIVATVYPMSRTAAGLGPAYAKAVEEAAEEVLRTARADLPTPHVDARAIANFSPARALHELAAEEAVDLLVIGASHRSAVGRALLGGTGDRLVHGAPCPVVAAPRDHVPRRTSIETIAVAYDGGAEADAALAWATRFAETAGADLVVIAASQFPVVMYPGWGAFPWEELTESLHQEAERSIRTAIERLPATVRAEARVVDGAVTPSITEAAADADLLVAGSRGYGPVGGVLAGSVSRGLMHDAPCPVVVVPRTTEAQSYSASKRSA